MSLFSRTRLQEADDLSHGLLGPKISILRQSLNMWEKTKHDLQKKKKRKENWIHKRKENTRYVIRSFYRRNVCLIVTQSIPEIPTIKNKNAQYSLKTFVLTRMKEKELEWSAVFPNTNRPLCCDVKWHFRTPVLTTTSTTQVEWSWGPSTALKAKG